MGVREHRGGGFAYFSKLVRIACNSEGPKHHKERISLPRGLSVKADRKEKTD